MAELLFTSCVFVYQYYMLNVNYIKINVKFNRFN